MLTNTALALFITLFSWFGLPYIIFFIFRNFSSLLKNLSSTRVVRSIAISQLLYGIVFIVMYSVYMSLQWWKLEGWSIRLFFLPLQAIYGLFLLAPQIILEIIRNKNFPVEFLFFWIIFIVIAGQFIKRYLHLKTKQSYLWVTLFVFISLFFWVLLSIVIGHFKDLIVFD